MGNVACAKKGDSKKYHQDQSSLNQSSVAKSPAVHEEPTSSGKYADTLGIPQKQGLLNKPTNLAKIFDAVNVSHPEKQRYTQMFDSLVQAHQFFMDQEFSPQYTSISHDINKFMAENKIRNVPQWLPPDQIFGQGNYTFLKVVDPNQIIQGILGDCYLLSAMSALAERPEFVRRIFQNDDISPYGIYSIWLCINGEWQSVLVDPYLSLIHI
eukprot:TRINITY_DN15245_c0_g1_i1.p1 TRINITY_DN15245_c0_g1~~TRINITY_DN15245_c0_g1_i1.p1  ORF type:complete len:211 (-),score=37.03 TRINITY_DN15245_c0_g1_i1:59-691(-)